MDSEETDHLLSHPPQHQPFHSSAQLPQSGQSTVQGPGNAFNGPYQYPASQHPAPYPHGSSNQMQQQVVVVGQQQQPQIVIASPQQRNQFFCHIVLSCFVFWFCGCFCGAIAFALAVYAKSYSDAGHPTGARRLGYLSIVASIIGIVVGVVIITVFVVAVIINKKHIKPK